MMNLRAPVIIFAVIVVKLAAIATFAYVIERNRVGDDGLTNRERKDLEGYYGTTAGNRPLTDFEKAAYEKWREQKEAEKTVPEPEG